MLTYPLAHVCCNFVSDLHAQHELVRVQRRQPVTTAMLKVEGQTGTGQQQSDRAAEGLLLKNRRVLAGLLLQH
jgi:hypothetical protein